MYSKVPSRPTAWKYEIGEMNIEIRQGGTSMVPEMRTSLPQDRQGSNAVAGQCQNSAHRIRHRNVRHAPKLAN
jgi:hypothetical protein